jgi:hypothetical protein
MSVHLDKSPRSSKSLLKHSQVVASNEHDENSDEPTLGKYSKIESEQEATSPSVAQRNNKMQKNNKSKSKEFSLFTRFTLAVGDFIHSVPIVKNLVPFDFLNREILLGKKFRVHSQVPNRQDFVVFRDYTFFLNQTNVDRNNNKFYVGQLLVNKQKSQPKESYFAFFCWGRNGDQHPQKMFKEFSSWWAATSTLISKFYEKTGNSWSSRGLNHFKKIDGKYQVVETVLEFDDDDDDEEDNNKNDQEEKEGKQQQHQSRNTPSLSQAQILKGLSSLDRLRKLFPEQNDDDQGNGGQINKNKSQIDQLSCEYFSLIPTDSFGRRKVEAFSSIEEVEEKIASLKFILRMAFDLDKEILEICFLRIATHQKRKVFYLKAKVFCGENKNHCRLKNISARFFGG